jgi:DNA polymerase I
VSKDTVFIIDASSYIFRAYYAVRPLTNSKGLPTNATYGFLKMLKNTIKNFEPSHIVMAMDSKEKTFRKEMYEKYKANREETPVDLNKQIPYIERLLEAFNIKAIKIPGVEADDIIASLIQLAKKEEKNVVIISGDKDLMQLVDDNTYMMDTMKNKKYDIIGVQEKFGVKPSQVLDFLSLVGDASDNIPGVKGIGPKGAKTLLNKFNTLEDIYKNINKIKNEKQSEKLLASKDMAFLSKKLISLKKDIKFDFEIKDLKKQDIDKEKLKDILEDLEFTSELKEWKLLVEKEIKTDKPFDKINPYTIFYENTLVGYDLLKNLNFSQLSKYENIFDIKLASYVLNPGKRDYPIDDISIKYAKSGYSHEVLPIIKEKLEKSLKEKGLWKVFNKIDTPCIKVLKEMEESGCLIDIEKLENLEKEVSKITKEKTKEIYKITEEEFNINSPKQLSYILFEKLKLPVAKKIPSGFSTNQEVLKELSQIHPLPKLILEYRETTKLHNTYILPLLEQAKTYSGRIKTKYHLDITSTGRISSTNPNLQNIPIRTAMGSKIRQAFIAPRGKVLISADYSQIELLILAHLSDDENMKKAFKENSDIHIETASEIFDIPREMVTPEFRRQAKAVNFGIMYGKTAFGLAKELNITQATASKIIKKYFKRFYKIDLLRKKIIEDAKKTGFTKTIFGRIRYIDDINNSNHFKKAMAERNAINSPIQGSASDILKIAMVNVWGKLKEFEDTKIILNVHDELLIETSKKDLDRVKAIIKKEMEEAVTLDPKLKVEISSGKTWLEAH